jgi:hypothetical protein
MPSAVILKEHNDFQVGLKSGDSIFHNLEILL